MTSRTFSLFFLFFVTCCPTVAWSQSQFREWSDSTGKFTITAKLLEVKEGVAFLENPQGSTLKIPVTRLSQKDQDFLASADNPFEMVEESPFEAVRGSGAESSPTSKPASSSNSPAAASSRSSMASVWSTPKETDWLRANQIPLTGGGGWNVPPPTPVKLLEQVKPAGLLKKSNFHEKVTGLVVNAARKRAVVGYKVEFAVPKPLTRLALVDLTSGKAIHTEAIEANMRPLALLDSGSAVLMAGDGDGDKGFETGGMLQIWRITGRSIERSGTWIPYTGQAPRFGRNEPTRVMNADVVSSELVLLLGSSGRLALWNLPRREAIWYADLNQRNLAYALSPDRSLLALYSEKTVAVVKPETGELLGSTTFEGNAPAGWNRIQWSPSGKFLLASASGNQRVISVQDGTVTYDIPTGIVAMKGLAYPDDDYALINNAMLIHLPSRIKVCEYRNCGEVRTVGDTAFIAFSRGEGGLLVPSKFPHPRAAELLAKAQDDPETFLVYPGVGVSIDVSGVGGQWTAEVRSGIEQSIERSGYKLDPSSPIKITAEISGPKQDAVSYIGEGSFVVQRYTSNVAIKWNGKALWQQGGTNIPGFMMLSRDESIKDELAKASKLPNVSMFENSTYPKFIQRPSQGEKNASSDALLVSSFTLQGLVDSK